MNTKILIGLAVAIVVVGGMAVYMITGNNSNTFEPEANLSGRFEQVLASGEDVKCDFAHDDEQGNVTEGVVYVSDGGEKIRADFMFSQRGEESFEGHVIRDGTTNYVWGSFAEQGIQSEITIEEQNELFKSEDAEIPDTVVYHCSKWSVDNEQFEKPSNITFLDVSSQMNITGQNVGDMKAFQCSACESIPDATQRAQCLSALSC